MADKDKKTAKVQDSNGTFGELKDMVTGYAKQQTVEPLKNLAKWAGFGVAGGVMMTIGAFLLGLGTLRLFQKIDWADEGNSWLPYIMVFVILLVAALACFMAMMRTPEWMDDDA